MFIVQSHHFMDGLIIVSAEYTIIPYIFQALGLKTMKFVRRCSHLLMEQLQSHNRPLGTTNSKHLRLFFVMYHAGHDISRLMEMVWHTSFPFEALALSLPMHDGPATQAVGVPPFYFGFMALQHVSNVLFDSLLFSIHVLVS